MERGWERVYCMWGWLLRGSVAIRRAAQRTMPSRMLKTTFGDKMGLPWCSCISCSKWNKTLKWERMGEKCRVGAGGLIGSSPSWDQQSASWLSIQEWMKEPKQPIHLWGMEEHGINRHTKKGVESTIWPPLLKLPLNPTPPSHFIPSALSNSFLETSSFFSAAVNKNQTAVLSLVLYERLRA
jgi:hypothetical protein